MGTIQKPEPVVTRAAIASVIVTLAAVLGITVDSQLVDAIAGVAAVLAPLVLGWLARRHVTPTEGRHAA